MKLSTQRYKKKNLSQNQRLDAKERPMVARSSRKNFPTISHTKGCVATRQAPIFRTHSGAPLVQSRKLDLVGPHGPSDNSFFEVDSHFETPIGRLATLIAHSQGRHESSHRFPHCKQQCLYRSDNGTTIPHARRLEVARNPKTDELGNDIDIVVCGQFDNEAELATYKGSIRRLRPLRELGFDRL
ncbi:antibiotic biosynthesis monooxygenase family protein [Bradyrhizobium sp. 23AC]